MRSYFDKIVGNEDAKRRIGAAIEAGRLPHALMLVGKPGSGKLTFAKQIAAALNCENKNSDIHSLPCNMCNTCRRIMKDGFLDVKLFEKEPEKASFRVDIVRNMLSDIMLSPTESDYKVYIFKGAHTMNDSAQNALLKILEEPPEGGILILLVEETDKILTTIKSRVQTVAMQQFEYRTIDEYLTKNSSTAMQLKSQNREAYESAVSCSDGCIGRAMELVSPEASAKIQNRQFFLKEFIEIFCKSAPFSEIKAKIAMLPSSRNELADILEELYSGVSELITVKYDTGAIRTLYRNSDEALKISRKIGIKKLVSLYELLKDIQNDCLENANIHTLLTAFAAKIAQLQ